MNKPQEISIAEWKEIMNVPAVHEAWGLEGETPEEFADIAYGVKFRYSSGMMPGYVGDLYIVSGDALGEPFSVVREDGQVPSKDASRPTRATFLVVPVDKNVFSLEKHRCPLRREY